MGVAFGQTTMLKLKDSIVSSSFVTHGPSSLQGKLVKVKGSLFSSSVVAHGPLSLYSTSAMGATVKVESMKVCVSEHHMMLRLLHP